MLVTRRKNISDCKIRNSTVQILTSSGKEHVVLLGGGMSAEREVSLSSAQNVAKALTAMKYQVTYIDVGHDIAIRLHEIEPPYTVFNCLHGTHGEDGCIVGLLNIMNVAYTHSGLETSALAFNKHSSKIILEHHGINTPNSMIINKKNLSRDPISRPYIIKPINQGSSIGVKPVLPNDNFVIENYNFEFGDNVLVEEYITGRELQVAVLDGEILGIMEIKLLHSKLFYDYQSKYNTGFAEKITSPSLSKKIIDQIVATSQRVYEIFQCRGPCRLDYMLSNDSNKLYVLELNTHPGMTDTSIFPAIAASKDISFNELVERILATAQCDKLVST